jgi:hypothetical protein
MSPFVEKLCPLCNGPMIEMERLGERLIGASSAIAGRGLIPGRVSRWRCPRTIYM